MGIYNKDLLRGCGVILTGIWQVLYSGPLYRLVLAWHFRVRGFARTLILDSQSQCVEPVP